MFSRGGTNNGKPSTHPGPPLRLPSLLQAALALRSRALQLPKASWKVKWIPALRAFGWVSPKKAKIRGISTVGWSTGSSNHNPRIACKLCLLVACTGGPICEQLGGGLALLFARRALHEQHRLTRPRLTRSKMLCCSSSLEKAQWPGGGGHASQGRSYAPRQLSSHSLAPVHVSGSSLGGVETSLTVGKMATGSFWLPKQITPKRVPSKTTHTHTHTHTPRYHLKLHLSRT